MAIRYERQKAGHSTKLINMRSFVLFTSCLACLILNLFPLPAIPGASINISLTDHEKKLLGKGDIIVREIGNPGRSGRTFEAVGYINGPRKDIVEVLADYEKYPEFMPNVSHIEIVEQVGNDSVLNYTLSLPLGKIKKYRLKISAAGPEEQTSIIKWYMVEWLDLKKSETIKDTTGYWRIEEKSRNRSLVQYHVYTDPGPIPLGLGWIINILTEKSVPETLLKTRERVQGYILGV